MKKLALSILTAISLLVILSMQPMAMAYEPIDTLVPPDNKYYCYENFYGGLKPGRWIQDYGQITFYWQTNPSDAWLKMEPFYTSGGRYHAAGAPINHDYFAMTAKFRSYQPVTQQAYWYIGLMQTRSGHEYQFRWLIEDTSPNTRCFLEITKDGFMQWKYEVYVGPGMTYWFYYRMILGYKLVGGAWRSWAWFYLGETGGNGGWGTPGTWFFAGECDLTNLLGFGTRGSGSGVADYANFSVFGRSASNEGKLDPDIDVDFIATKCDGQSPFP